MGGLPSSRSISPGRDALESSTIETWAANKSTMLALGELTPRFATLSNRDRNFFRGLEPAPTTGNPKPSEDGLALRGAVACRSDALDTSLSFRSPSTSVAPLSSNQFGNDRLMDAGRDVASVIMVAQSSLFPLL